ncbi:MAG: DUF3445 domain-containing protein [Rhizobiaceae bacterium]|nr:DUF3445 domain-containing protein [Rhizobiaceae bacterium]
MNYASPTPFDDSSKPFTIGLKPLELSDWIEVDASYDAQLREKRRIEAEHLDQVFVAEPGTETAQQEVLDLLRIHLPRRFPERFRGECKGLAISGHPALTIDEMRALPPLRAAARLVAEDLILMRRGDSGWRLVAGSLCFPSHWSLTEKFGLPMQGIHAPVPGFGPGTRTAELINRIFDKLLVEQPVQRWNWSVQAGGELYRPFGSAQQIRRATERPSKFPDGDIPAHAFIRVERQTLRKLPSSGDILFTIRIYLDPLMQLMRHPERRSIAASFARQLDGLETVQLDYKGLTADRDRLVALLEEIAAGD